MNYFKQFLMSLFSFKADDLHLLSGKDGIPSTAGAIGGAFYGGKEAIVSDTIIGSLTSDLIWDIVFTALIGAVVAFFAKKILVALWDYILKPLLRYLKKITIDPIIRFFNRKIRGY